MKAPPSTDDSQPAAAENSADASTHSSVFDFTKGRNRRQSQQFFNTVVVLGTVAIGYFGLTTKLEDAFLLYQGLLILALSLLPAILWTRFLGHQFPTFETFLFTFSNSFAIPLLTGHRQLVAYTDHVISMAAWGVITFQVAAIGTFYVTTALPKRTPFWREEVFSDQIGRYLGYAMVLNSVFVVLSTYFTAIPRDLIGPLRAVFFGIGILCTFVQSLRWGQGSLKGTEKTYFMLNLAIQILVLTGTLFLINGVSLLILALAGYVCGARRIPVMICVAAMFVLGILHNGKFVMREKYWEGVDSPTARNDEFLDLPAFYLEWFTAGLKIRDEYQTASDPKHKLLERTSLFHMLCLVISLSPEKLSFLEGETYGHIPGQFVPRFFWPEKPVGHVSTHRLSVYYGLQQEEDTIKTTIAFGILPEAYANFGFFGLAFVGALVGFCQKMIRAWSAQSPILSYPGIFTVLLMSWSLSTETTMSIWLTSLYQACIAVLGLIVIVRSFLK